MDTHGGWNEGHRGKAMTKRDKDKLAGLLVRLTAEFSAPNRQSTTLYRGDVRAIVAAIRELAAGKKGEKA